MIWHALPCIIRVQVYRVVIVHAVRNVFAVVFARIMIMLMCMMCHVVDISGVAIVV